jgi:hypothetical protein
MGFAAVCRAFGGLISMRNVKAGQLAVFFICERIALSRGADMQYVIAAFAFFSAALLAVLSACGNGKESEGGDNVLHVGATGQSYLSHQTAEFKQLPVQFHVDFFCNGFHDIHVKAGQHRQTRYHL